jgi:hypothetical protein
MIDNVFLNPAETETLTFVWDTSSIATGNYTLKGEASRVPNEVNTADNMKLDGTVSIQLEPEEMFFVTVSVTDNGGNPISNAAVYTSQESKLTDGGFVVFKFTKGSYTISAYKHGYQTVSSNVYVDRNMSLVLVLLPNQFPFIVGGYSVSTKGYNSATSAAFYLSMMMILSTLFTGIRRKTRKK